MRKRIAAAALAATLAAVQVGAQDDPEPPPRVDAIHDLVEHGRGILRGERESNHDH